MKISVSFLCDNPREMIKKASESECDYLHVDIMDGKFVNNKSFTFSEVKKLVNDSKKKLDVHLMVNNPIKYIEDYALLNTEYITFHYESTTNINEVIECIKNYGLKVGISIKPDTDINSIIPFISSIDLVLIMGVEPGKSGQVFKESILYKVEALKKTIEEKHLNTLISIDGGMNEETSKMVKDNGADMVVCASYLNDNNFNDKIRLLKDL